MVEKLARVIHIAQIGSGQFVQGLSRLLVRLVAFLGVVIYLLYHFLFDILTRLLSNHLFDLSHFPLHYLLIVKRYAFFLKLLLH